MKTILTYGMMTRMSRFRPEGVSLPNLKEKTQGCGRGRSRLSCVVSTENPYYYK